MGSTKRPATTRRIYDNCLITAPDGMSLGRCTESRVRWYLRNGLADVISTEPTVIKLRFEPRGRAGAEQEIVTGAKENRCVVCGTNESLTRHHVVPSSLSIHLPLHYKRWCSHDVVPLCSHCHYSYNEKAYMEELLKEYGIEEEFEQLNTTYCNQRRAYILWRGLRKNGHVIPLEAQAKMRARLRGLLGIPDDQETPETVARPTKVPSLGRFLMSKITDHFGLIKMWRKHFVETMQPRYLPRGWTIDYYPSRESNDTRTASA
jgi:hypothetical protein